MMCHDVLLACEHLVVVMFILGFMFRVCIHVSGFHSQFVIRFNMWHDMAMILIAFSYDSHFYGIELVTLHLKSESLQI